MFDKIYLRAGDSHHSHHHEVHEHRAPTDESIRLYKEMEDKALRSVLEAVRIMNTNIDCVVHHMEDVKSLDTKFVIQYRFAGRRIRVDVPIDLSQCGARSERMEKIARTLVKELSESIAVHMLDGVANDLLRLEWSRV